MNCPKCGVNSLVSLYSDTGDFRNYYCSNCGCELDERDAPSDAVKHPAHYAKGGVECIAAIKASMTTEAYRGYLKGNCLKYLWRYEDKGKPAEDLRKALEYLGWLLKEVDG